MRSRPGWQRKRRGWAMQAPRCWCGWYTSTAGIHDPNYLGHGPRCPVKLYGKLTTAAEVADQWALLTAWARACEPLGDAVDWQQTWLDHSWALAQRAQMLDVSLPVEDDVSALTL